MPEIPVKKKYRPDKSLFGYQRNHQGNGRKKSKKISGIGGKPYDRRSVVLVLQANMKKRFFYGEDAKRILGDA